ncbi:MAG: 3-deoxy-manno-octulosonate cytidylyltransferase [Bdellovibrionaceae bacterium]|nr:3-deoxy-manno-octulosonate cytidylyltransferase [Bdellovibrionales bacterium]MCB9086133.1 3-deoxy-manno-octulosonate cytidylyltransferase [Pseudobdellovibrionaceae bacterium]
MKILGVIPARYGSTRFPGKPLALVAGKPLLQWVIEGAKTSKKLSDVWVATDHQEIFDLATKCGAKAVMTESDLPSGSDRVWAAIQDQDCEVAVNIQGDEPLLSGELLDALVTPFFADPGLEMATLGRPLQEGDLESLSTAKIVMNERNEALYFSRFPIPYSRVDAKQLSGVCCKHIGLYAYRKPFLQRFCQQGPVDLERAESLEQLRALYLGARIRVVGVEHDSWGVDTPEDVAKIESIIQTGRGHGRT